MSEAIVQNMDIRSAVSAEEWAIRQDLAAAYRLVAHYGWDDMVFTHLSARVPGPEDHFLLNPYGFQFSEVTASNLVKVDLDGNVVLATATRSMQRGLPFTAPFIWRATMPRPSCTCTPTAAWPCRPCKRVCCPLRSTPSSSITTRLITTGKAWP